MSEVNDRTPREQLPPLQRAVSDALDDYLGRKLGVVSSSSDWDMFLSLLADEGYVVTAADTVNASALLRDAAAGRREYGQTLTAQTGPFVRAREDLELQASTLEGAAEVVAGDLGPLYGWLPSWRWTDEMNARMGGQQ